MDDVADAAVEDEAVMDVAEEDEDVAAEAVAEDEEGADDEATPCSVLAAASSPGVSYSLSRRWSSLSPTRRSNSVRGSWLFLLIFSFQR